MNNSCPGYEELRLSPFSLRGMNNSRRINDPRTTEMALDARKLFSSHAPSVRSKTMKASQDLPGVRRAGSLHPRGRRGGIEREARSMTSGGADHRTSGGRGRQAVLACERGTNRRQGALQPVDRSTTRA